MLQLALFGYVFALAVLIYASVLDVKSREISNKVWILAYPAGCALTIAAVAIDSVGVDGVIFSLGVSVVLGWILLYFGFCGGADVKALIFVALTVPVYPTASRPLGDVAGPLVLTMFCNAILLSLIWPCSIFALNVRDMLKGEKMFEGINLTLREKVLLFFTARKVSLEKLEKNLAYFPSETVVNQDGKLTRKILRFVKAETDLSQYLINLKENREIYKDGVLATSTIPFIVFFTLALAIAPVGNLAIWTISYLLNI